MEGSALMNASNTHEAAPGWSTPAVVGPSRFVRVVIGPMTKVLNPVMLKVAGRRRAMVAAQVRHVGRKSGRQYVTPVGAGRAGGTFVIPLTFGNQSDWSRNVRAAGGCVIRLNGVDYQVSRPELADRAQAAAVVRRAFNPVMRAGFRMLGIRQFLLLTLD
jgi:deazaflavin-dependent oxidoreductase (nitroreductase family)